MFETRSTLSVIICFNSNIITFFQDHCAIKCHITFRLDIMSFMMSFRSLAATTQQNCHITKSKMWPTVELRNVLLFLLPFHVRSLWAQTHKRHHHLLFVWCSHSKNRSWAHAMWCARSFAPGSRVWKQITIISILEQKGMKEGVEDDRGREVCFTHNVQKDSLRTSTWAGSGKTL